MDHELTRTLRQFLGYRRLLVTGSVAGTMGTVEWLAIGHPVGLVFGLLMGLITLLLAPLPWLWILPWGLRGPLPVIFLRATAVLACSAVVVLSGFLLFFFTRDLLAPEWQQHPSGAIAHLSSWSAAVVSVPLFAGAGWGLSRHSELERRLEVQDERAVALRRALDEARLMALQSRLDPHFLFNALNLVAELCVEDPDEAERCVVRLSGLLRAALEHGEAPLIPLGRELDLCGDYLELCKTRFGQRLQVEIERTSGAEGARVPLFAVQVLCENAVLHGVERTPGGGVVRIETVVQDGHVQITVTNPGAFRAEPRRRKRGGLGIDLTRRRLDLAYGASATLSVATNKGGDSTVATLSIPHRQYPQEEEQADG